jgi:hypothetical protein
MLNTRYPRRTVLLLATACVTVAALLACSSHNFPQNIGTAPRVGATHYPNACATLTRHDAESALGEPVDGEGTYEPNDGGTCTYSNNANGSSVQLQVVDPAIGRKVVQPADSVPGLGDEALDNHGWLFVRKGDIGLIFLLVKPLGDLPAPIEDTVRQLATTALGRI